MSPKAEISAVREIPLIQHWASVCVFTSVYTLQTPSVYFWNILSYPSSESIDQPQWKVSFRSFMMCLHISCRSLVCESLKATRRFIFTQWKCFWSRLLSQRWGRTVRMTRALTSFCSSLQILCWCLCICFYASARCFYSKSILKCIQDVYFISMYISWEFIHQRCW